MTNDLTIGARVDGAGATLVFGADESDVKAHGWAS